jgi:hypothetical protein
MKRLSTLVVLAAVALALCVVTASAQTTPEVPLSIAHRGPLTGKPGALFNQTKDSFSEGRFGPYTIVGDYPASHTLVVKRSNIDSANWSRWAYCKMGPMDLLDSLRDGSVTMTIRFAPTTRWITWVLVKAEFTGTYGLGSTVKQTECISTGVLEEDMLRRLGVNVP